MLVSYLFLKLVFQVSGQSFSVLNESTIKLSNTVKQAEEIKRSKILLNESTGPGSWREDGSRRSDSKIFRSILVLLRV